MDTLPFERVNSASIPFTPSPAPLASADGRPARAPVRRAAPSAGGRRRAV